MNRVELLNIVKSKIDEISSSDELLVPVGIEDNKPYDTIIETLLDESAIEVLLKAPFYRLTISNSTSLEIVKKDSNTGIIILPTDFLRLLSFRMTEWERSVTQPAIKGDDISNMQSNKFIRGGQAKPIGVLTRTDKGLALEYYSVKVDHTLAEFFYVKKQKAEDIEDIQMIDAMTWICAGKVLGVVGKFELAKNCYENANGLLV